MVIFEAPHLSLDDLAVLCYFGIIHYGPAIFSLGDTVNVVYSNSQCIFNILELSYKFQELL